MPSRSKLLIQKGVKQEQELRIITNPRFQLLSTDDYQAPLTAHYLLPNSKWIIVRNNLHKIRSWRNIDTSNVDPRFHDWYIFFQMRRELRRAQEHINRLEHQPNFVPMRHFNLPVDVDKVRRYNVSNVKPSDAVYYPGLGRDPIVVQALLFYFSKECAVPYESMFRTFLSDICAIIDQDQQRLNRAAVFRRIALTMTIIIFLIIAFMFCSLIVSIISTTSNFRNMYDNDVDGMDSWRDPSATLATNLQNL